MSRLGESQIHMMEGTTSGKKGFFSPPSTMSSEEFRRLIGVGATIMLLVMILFTLILFLGMYIFTKVATYPGVHLVGTAVGNVTADLGPMGRMEMHPEFYLESNIKLT